jgi:hypothetical protein
VPHPRSPRIGRTGGCRKYEVLALKIVHRRHCTGFEQNRELPLHIDDLIAGRYQVGATSRVGQLPPRIKTMRLFLTKTERQSAVDV